ncbi:MAG: FAD-dependent oxidoreductase [Oscillospiraceae bacterium]|nr:FAD-dependent oxidoreductase [Oscillospiraceae bacterium]MBR4693143.1 FAD-dependent oxidoreductase [Oscillospiraceae bacterium]
MKSIIEERREIPVAGETDVLVVGGGLAGVAAAAAAARNGVSVTLLEKTIALGGLATLGHVCVYLPIDDGLGHRIYGGLAEELMQVCHRYSYDDIPECWKGSPWRVDEPTGRYQCTFNIPACVMALDEFTDAEGVNVMFDTGMCLPIMEGNTCRGVFVENKSGRSAYLAKMVVDATGDADVLFRAGADCETRKSIVSTWTYELDVDRIKNETTSNEVLANIRMRWFGLRPDVDNSKSEIPTFYGTTADGVNDYVHLSRTLALDYLKKHDRPGYAFLTMPAIPQFRMTRRLKGLKELQCVEGRYEEHSVGIVIHCLENPAAVYEFPYEAVIDARIENVAAAGRMVSAGGRGWEIMRCIPNCVFTGQVAGTAAAMAVRGGVPLQRVDVAALQQNLADTGVVIHAPEELKHNSQKERLSYRRASGVASIATDSLSYPKGDAAGH